MILGWLLFQYLGTVPKDVAAHALKVGWGEESLTGGRSPREIIRYLERRLVGHPKLEFVFLPFLHAAQRHVERPVPEAELPSLGKGVQDELPFTYPVAMVTRVVVTVDQVEHALRDAQPGQVIELAPGRYVFARSPVTGQAGTASRPIVLRAARPGSVFIEFDAEEGFHITQPYWVFENLDIKGICKRDHDCEHAFHVVGKARRTVIRNNRLHDFNAHLKVNGVGDDWPDDGIFQFNTVTNHHPRITDRPVTSVDIVGANRWRIADNVLSDFVKDGGHNVSYGIYMKGAGREGQIERNLLICTSKAISQPGVRVGISLGGGGTGAEFCRDKPCNAEYFSGVVSNNVIAHCNDFGIDVFRSAASTIAHNTLLNTAGIDVRNTPASAHVYGNLLEGLIRSRNGGKAKLEMNEIGDLTRMFLDADRLDLRWQAAPMRIPSLSKVAGDFCGRQREDGTLPGAFADTTPCQPRAVLLN